MGKINLYNDNCLTILDTLLKSGCKVDCIVTDPPYLIAYKTSRRKDKTHKFCHEIDNDRPSDTELIKNFIEKSFQLLKDNSAFYCFCSWKTSDIFKNLLEKAGFTIKNQIIWVKNNHTSGDLKAQFGQQYEVCFYCNKGRKFINGKRLTDVWFFDRVSGKSLVHQNQKPVELIEQIILKSTDENDTILDPFMGSGTTGIACVNNNRNFIGIELDKQYFDIAQNRIKEAVEKKRNNNA